MNKATLEQWVGKSQISHDIIESRPVRLMKSIVDYPSGLEHDTMLPALWHWLYFPDITPLDQLASDGHAQKGGFLPPIALPRRMWAGGDLKFVKPIRIGDKIERISTIESIKSKRGKTGELCFVTVCHEFICQGTAAIKERHHIVYREQIAKAHIPHSAPDRAKGDWHQLVKPNPAMLFRYSALTFNTHRIHYDREYCRKVENYPGLVFHGPLTATLLVNLAVSKMAGKQLTSFKFRAIAPLFDGHNIEILGRKTDSVVSLWAQNDRNELAMTATANFI